MITHNLRRFAITGFHLSRAATKASKEWWHSGDAVPQSQDLQHRLPQLKIQGGAFLEDKRHRLDPLWAPPAVNRKWISQARSSLPSLPWPWIFSAIFSGGLLDYIADEEFEHVTKAPRAGLTFSSSIPRRLVVAVS